jgi:hypothetical protein
VDAIRPVIAGELAEHVLHKTGRTMRAERVRYALYHALITG